MRVLLVGLDRPESEELRAKLTCASVAYATLPVIKVEGGVLLVERPGTMGQFLPVDKVVYHGIYENDFEFIQGLALWGGPCLPNAVGMMRCRLRIPCLAEALTVTRFGGMKRGWGNGGTLVRGEGPSVAKWGNWHCGENKERFEGAWEAKEVTVVEPFIEGEAVRIMLIGERYWQIRLTGETWLKSIHPDDAAFMEVREELLADTRALARHFDLAVCGVDYMIGKDGVPRMLEVNHIPNVTRFEEVRGAFLEMARAWVEG
jgi:hypothetical protein